MEFPGYMMDGIMPRIYDGWNNETFLLGDGCVREMFSGMQRAVKTLVVRTRNANVCVTRS